GYEKTGSKEADSTRFYMKRSLDMLGGKRDFDRFDRLGFLTLGAMPLQRHLGLLIRELKLELNTAAAINEDAADVFAPDALNPDVFPHALGAGVEGGAGGRDEGGAEGG